MVRVHFSIGIHSDYADCDVVPMETCSLLLGRPWEYDNDACHHGRRNKYTIMHKGKKITLLPLTPAQIVQAEKDRAANANNEPPVKSENVIPGFMPKLSTHRMHDPGSNVPHIRPKEFTENQMS
jgi:hypothetical protein